MYKLFLSVRYLRARLISYVAIAGMAIGVLALVVVLSVMNGFQMEFRARIRGTQAHLTVESGRFFGMTDWRSVRDTLIRASEARPPNTPAVLAAAPFIQNIVLVKAADAKDYGFIEGVLVEEEVHVSDLGKYLLSEAGLARELHKNSMDFARRVYDTRVSLPEEHPSHLTREEADEALERKRRRFEQYMSGLPDSVDLDGLFQARESDLPGLVVGLEFFKRYALGVGGTVTLLTTSDVEKDLEHIESRTQVFEVTGVFKTGIWDVDRRTCLAELGTAQDFILGGRDAVTGLHLKISDFARAGETAGYVEEALEAVPDYYPMRLKVDTWETKNSQLLSAVDMEKRLLWIILFFMIVVAGMNIVSILAMSVVEKTRDLGIVKAVGGTRGGLVSIFLGQGLLIGVMGSGLGLAGGLALVHWINEVAEGIKTVTGYHPFPQNIYYLDRIPTLVDPWLIARIVVPTVAVSILFALYPAWKAGRLDPIEALRHE